MNDAPELTPRDLQIIRAQRVILLASAFGVPYLLYVLLESVHLTPFGWWWILFAVFSAFAAKTVFKILSIITALAIYGFDLGVIREETDQMRGGEKNEPTPLRKELALTIMSKPDAPIGFYYDSEIYEWLELKTPEGVNVTACFEDTVSPKQQETYQIPDDHILIPPGVLYKLVLKIE